MAERNFYVFFEVTPRDLDDDNHFELGECEDCGSVVSEWLLRQCEFGFCGKFVCEACVKLCSRCERWRPLPETVPVLCMAHVDKLRRKCSHCEILFCDLCTSFLKCHQCKLLQCSRCQVKNDQVLLKCGLCKKCNRRCKEVKNLQDLCRAAVRGAIASKVQYLEMGVNCLTPTPLPNRDERSSVSTIETILDRVNTALRGIQRSMRTQPSRDAMLDMQREISAVLRNVERMNV